MIYEDQKGLSVNEYMYVRCDQSNQTSHVNRLFHDQGRFSEVKWGRRKAEVEGSESEWWATSSRSWHVDNEGVYGVKRLRHSRLAQTVAEVPSCPMLPSLSTGTKDDVESLRSLH